MSRVINTKERSERAFLNADGVCVIVSRKKDSLGRFHNDNGPALITDIATYFLTHEEEWELEKYETFIREQATQLLPNENLNGYPFNQLESIVYTLNNWPTRQTYPISPKVDWGSLLSATP